MLNIVFKEFPEAVYNHFFYPLLRQVAVDERA